MPTKVEITDHWTDIGRKLFRTHENLLHGRTIDARRSRPWRRGNPSAPRSRETACYYVAEIDVTNPDAYSSPAAAAFHVSLAIPALLRAVDTHHGYSQPERR